MSYSVREQTSHGKLGIERTRELLPTNSRVCRRPWGFPCSGPWAWRWAAVVPTIIDAASRKHCQSKKFALSLGPSSLSLSLHTAKVAGSSRYDATALKCEGFSRQEHGIRSRFRTRRGRYDATTRLCGNDEASGPSFLSRCPGFIKDRLPLR